MGFLGAMFAGGLLLGSALWTLLVTFTTPTVAWIVIAVGLALGQWMTLVLRRIPPGQELEEIATYSAARAILPCVVACLQ